MNVTKVTIKGFANTYIIEGNEGAILIDTGLPRCENAILGKCREKNISLKLIVITHGHFDHTGSAAALKRETGALVAVHSEDAQALRTGISKMDRPVGFIAHLMPLLMRSAKTDPLEPDILVDKEMSFKEYGVDGKIILTPGHTSGSISVMLNSGEAFVGDLIMGGFFGKFRSRHPNLSPFEIGRSYIKNSVKHVLEQNPTAIYPTHGGPFTPEAVAKWYERL